MNRTTSIGKWAGVAALLTAAVFIGLPHQPAAAQTAATLVIMNGDTPAGAPGAVTSLNEPFVNGLGQVGLVGVAGGVQFVWVNGAIVWLDTDDAVNGLNPGDTVGMGISDAGNWVYGPESGILDTVYSDAGLLFMDGDIVPGIDGVTSFSAIYEPLMADNGDIFFVASIDAAGGTSVTTGRILVRLAGGSAANFQILLQTGDAAGTSTLDTFGVDSNQYNISPDGTHYITVVDLATGGTTDDGGIVVDGVLVAQELSPAGSALVENWDNFDALAINNAGNYVFTGDTDNTDASIDEFIAYNGTIIARELDTADNGNITFDGSIDGIDINSANHLVYVWDNGTTESLFITCDASDVNGSTRVLLADNADIDVTGDGTADHTVTDFLMFPTGGNGIAFTDDGMVYVEVQLDGSDEAIIGLEAGCCGDGVVGGSEACDDGGESATCNADCTVSACGDGIMNATANEACDDGGESATCNADCSVAGCGDSIVNATAGEACDDGGVNSATCNFNCTAAACGDGTYNAVAGEQCDDGNTTDGDGCSSTCQFEGVPSNCGDGVVDTGEDCDDGGESATCNVNCTTAACGDGIVNTTAAEECEDGNTTDGDGCSSTCEYEGMAGVCGDGTHDAGEQCDDGNTDDGDGCSSTCTLEGTSGVCGDGTVDTGEACDDMGESATCNADCTAATCGDGILNTTAGEECEDGNGVDNDGCSSLCELEGGGSADDDGCGCAASSDSSLPAGTFLVLILGFLLVRRFRAPTLR